MLGYQNNLRAIHALELAGSWIGMPWNFALSAPTISCRERGRERIQKEKAQVVGACCFWHFASGGLEIKNQRNGELTFFWWSHRCEVAADWNDSFNIHGFSLILCQYMQLLLKATFPRVSSVSFETGGQATTGFCISESTDTACLKGAPLLVVWVASAW